MIQWRIIRNVILYNEHVRINLFSNTNDDKNSASTLLSEILFFGVCLHWFSKQRHHSHPFAQQQLLRSRYPSSNLIGRPVFSLCETEKIRRSVRKKNIRIFGARMFAVYVEASIGSCCFIPACHRVRNSFCFFALSVERPLIPRARPAGPRHKLSILMNLIPEFIAALLFNTGLLCILFSEQLNSSKYF